MADRNSAGARLAHDAAAGRSAARPALTAQERWHFCHLPFAYQLLIWAARMWNNEAIQPAERWSTIRQAFAKVNAEDATVPFLRFMEVVQSGATQAILIGEGGCTVYADEIRLAETVACTARGNHPEAAVRLRQLLAPSAARIACGLVSDLAAELDRAGLRFMRMRTLAAPETPAHGHSVH